MQAADASGLLFEERLERAEQRRLQGNQLFSAGRYKEALSKYAVVRVAGELANLQTLQLRLCVFCTMQRTGWQWQGAAWQKSTNLLKAASAASLPGVMFTCAMADGSNTRSLCLPGWRQHG